MKAVQLIEPGRRLQMREIPIPDPGSLDVLVRIKAAGICHSDAHYRAGRSKVHPLPRTLGHEVAGIVEKIGDQVRNVAVGDSVCLHYLVTCGICDFCRANREQFCPQAAMIGKHRDGGFAEFIIIPAPSVVRLPADIPHDQAAIMMCSTATSFHALKKARLSPGESVAIFGIGGLGSSAVQLAKVMGAAQVFAIDIKPAKLDLAATLGGVPINSAKVNPVQEILKLTDRRGVDVALELIGLPATMQQALNSLSVCGRLAVAGITTAMFEISPYNELINKEAEIIGVSDHLAAELPLLLQMAHDKTLSLSQLISRKISLDADAINQILDDLEGFGDSIRTVIVPNGG